MQIVSVGAATIAVVLLSTAKRCTLSAGMLVLLQGGGILHLDGVHAPRDRERSCLPRYLEEGRVQFPFYC